MLGNISKENINRIYNLNIILYNKTKIEFRQFHNDFISEPFGFALAWNLDGNLK